MPKAAPLLVVLLSQKVPRARGHSWAACTDYRGDVNYFEQDKCYGWPRNYRPAAQSDGYQIATPDSRAYSNGGCDVEMAATGWRNGYSAAFPFATYEAGEVYCLAWPMKNHGWLPSSCDNQQSKSDAGVRDDLHLYVSAVNPVVDPTQDAFNERNVNELAGLAKYCDPGHPNSNSLMDECQLGLEKHQDYEPDCKGFLRAPKFCESSGMAMGTGCFKIPDNMSQGHYVGQWWWQSSFRRGESLQTQSYMSCFDFEVVAPGSTSGHADSPGTKGTPQSDLPCQNNVLKLRNSRRPATLSTTSVRPDVMTSTDRGPTIVCAEPYAVCAQPDTQPRCCTLGHSCQYHSDSGYARCKPSTATSESLEEPEPEPEPEAESLSEHVASETRESVQDPEQANPTTCKGSHEVCAEPGWGPACCVSGHTCLFYEDSGYARCLPDPASEDPREPCKMPGETCATPGTKERCCTTGYACIHWEDSGYARCTATAFPTFHAQPRLSRPRVAAHTFLSRGQAMVQAKTVLSEKSHFPLSDGVEL